LWIKNKCIAPAKDKGDMQLGVKTSNRHRPDRKVKRPHNGHEPSIPSALHIGVIKVLQHLTQAGCELIHLDYYCVQQETTSSSEPIPANVFSNRSLLKTILIQIHSIAHKIGFGSMPGNQLLYLKREGSCCFQRP
jgi:hypothetical protein